MSVLDIKKREWTTDETNQLCDLMADGQSFGQAAVAMGRTRDSVLGRWRKIVKQMGPQAD